MKKQLASLIELQKMETAAGRIHAKKRNLPVQINRLEEEFKAFCAVVEQEREQLEDIRKRRKEKDAQLLAGQQNLKRTRERLFEVKTNKEYQSMLKEIEAFEGKNSRMEDEVIVLLDELDHLETALKTKDEELKARRMSYEEERAKIEAELNTLDAELGDYVRKGMEIRKDIPAELIRKYEQIKGAGRGVAVVAVWKEICDGCHMAIPPQMYNELQKEKVLITCPNCNRIIYWENRNNSEAH
ncbi:MAG: C4-type zinc ribbon domain-containing protein [Deltaproteobacteria bacterium]|nr:C4-type zinc ribbon domain-containing protein [Deltaproteobacteria bacterium]